MRILITNRTLDSGGAERVAVVWANSFVKLGHDVTLATDKREEDAPYIYPVDENVHMVKCYGFHPGKPTGVKAWFYQYCNFIYRTARLFRRTFDTHLALRKVIKSLKPDVIISLQEPNNVQTLFAALGTGIPVIGTEHNSFELPPPVKMPKKEWLCKFVASKWFPAVTVLTKADKRCISPSQHNVYVMPNPLALPIAKRIPENKIKRIVAVGRLDAYYYKGFDVLIKSWGLIANKFPDWNLDIAGKAISDETAIDKLKKMISDNELDGRCSLSGFHSDMQEYYAKSEIFVLSSRFEGFGMVLIEAMSQGCACIACDYRGRQSEIITNESEGLCIPPDNVESLAKAIEKMIVDESYRKTTQANALKRVSFYDPIKTAHRWESLINKVLQQKIHK